MAPQPRGSRASRLGVWLALPALVASLLGLGGCRCNRPSEPDEAETGVRLDEEPAPQPPPYLVRSSAIAGQTSLVAWRARGKDQGIRAVRLGPNGTVLDVKPIVLSTARNDSDIAVAGYDGGFWVVWEHFPEGRGVHIQGIRVSTAGKLLDEAPRLLTGPEETQRSPVVACTTKGCLLTYQDYRKDSYGSLYALYLNGDGSTGAPLPYPGKNHTASATATTSEGYLASFCGGLAPNRRDVATLRLPPQPGAKLPEPNLVSEGNGYNGVKIACGEKKCFAAWLKAVEVEGGPRHIDINGVRTYTKATRGEIWGCLLDKNGKVSKDAAPLRLRELDAGPRRTELLTLGAGPGGFLLAWEATTFGQEGYSSAGVLHIQEQGGVENVPVPAPGEKPSTDGSGWLVALSKRSEARDWLLAARLSAEGRPEWVVQPLSQP